MLTGSAHLLIVPVDLSALIFNGVLPESARLHLGNLVELGGHPPVSAHKLGGGFTFAA